MQIFYAPDIRDNIHCLDEAESRHCIKVLRMRTGDVVQLVDGKGNLCEGYISKPDLHKCEITVNKILRDFEKRDYKLHIAISPLKNHDRFEWFIEKSVEAGIDEITPLICRNTEKPGIRVDRINSIIISAMKQSLKAYRPKLNPPALFNDFICGEYNCKKMIAHCRRNISRSGINTDYGKGEDALILIGPEGDFTEQEVITAVERGFRSVHIGISRLRTETAGIAACLAVYFVNQQSKEIQAEGV